ncbi:hypothetical protein SAMN04489742_2153 [Arthrobacter crystallopoietes]|uniref:Uncharacterized protein n=1 Tax=Crystallibacter crystallopoietes TaxID=37928 RepID=A0A1H1CY32_9MICC|nr:hypothetical protein SAMN04489742_2153 [Arthrobacter crystallopoietes]
MATAEIAYSRPMNTRACQFKTPSQEAFSSLEPSKVWIQWATFRANCHPTIR